MTATAVFAPDKTFSWKTRGCGFVYSHCFFASWLTMVCTTKTPQGDRTWTL